MCPARVRPRPVVENLLVLHMIIVIQLFIIWAHESMKQPARVCVCVCARVMLLILARLVYLSGFGSVLHTHATYSQVAFNLFVQTLCSSIWISLLAARNNQAFKYTFINRVSLSTQAGAIVCAPNNNHLHFTMYNNTLHSITILLNYEYKFYKWIEWSRKRRRARDRERERETKDNNIYSAYEVRELSCGQT